MSDPLVGRAGLAPPCSLPTVDEVVASYPEGTWDTCQELSSAGTRFSDVRIRSGGRGLLSTSATLQPSMLRWKADPWVPESSSFVDRYQVG